MIAFFLPMGDQVVDSVHACGSIGCMCMCVSVYVCIGSPVDNFCLHCMSVSELGAY